MKCIVALSGKTTRKTVIEPRGFITAVNSEPAPGVLRQVMLGTEGLIFKRADVRVGIPLNELWALAEKHESKMKP